MQPLQSPHLNMTTTVQNIPYRIIFIHLFNSYLELASTTTNVKQWQPLHCFHVEMMVNFRLINFSAVHFWVSEDRPEKEGFLLPRRLSVVLWEPFLFPEKDIPEKQPTRIDQQGNEWENQRTVQEMVQNSLWDDWQVKQPAFLESDWHFLQLLEQKDRKKEGAGRAEDD